jgi:hypothetical protein
MATNAPSAESYGSIEELTQGQLRACAALPSALDLRVRVADPFEHQRRTSVDDARADSLAMSVDPRTTASAEYLDALGRSYRGIAVEAFDQLFELEPDEDHVGGFIEFGYLSGGWRR